MSLAGGGREWETVECAAARKSFACALYLLVRFAEDDLVQDFLWIDSCAKIADKVGPLFAWLACACVLVMRRT